MVPEFDREGKLPPGIYWATWKEVVQRFGFSPRRQALLAGFARAVQSLRAAGCRTVYLDGSFVTRKIEPGDYDACWGIQGVDVERLDAVFLDFSQGRKAQKAEYMGEFFPAELPEGTSGKRFLEFFQTDRETGRPKGIVALDLRELQL